LKEENWCCGIFSRKEDLFYDEQYIPEHNISGFAWRRAEKKKKKKKKKKGNMVDFYSDLDQFRVNN
jgi:hypothetical protein